MLANGIKQSTDTTGTGPLTLAVVTDMPTLANAFAVGQLFSYTLLNSAGLFIEAGYGYLSDFTTMVRARVLATYSGGYNGSTPSAISLTGTTTVICTPHASSLESMLPTVDSQSSGVNRMVTTAHRTTSVTAQAMVALRLSYVPFLFRSAGVVSALNMNVATAGAAGKVARLGMYSCNERGYPSALLASTADFAIDSTGLKVNSVTPKFLPAGWYFAASVSDGSPVISMHAAVSLAIGGGPYGFSGIGPIDFRHEVLADTALPSVASTTTTAVASGAQHVPMVYVGVE